ncbi:class I SAM-dependent methyltransferase [Rhabdothermincola sediminis]|uniref:class I SAM-dependent methyltransferase n=1 Tax=Rhabdothermincola sediminis TaxID=2751370 RepID=UPI001AA02050|nr:class I SAM-dependent methyltransferase [Rhabdothermincola sediminis]
MGFYDDQIVPRVTNLVLGTRQIGKLRARALAEVTGTVVELGFGSGTNLPYYPPPVERVLAVEPSEVGRRLARGRLAASRIPVEFVGLDGARIPLEDESVDSAVSTWTLCTIPDVDRALAEVHRVLKPGGRFFFLEHGLSDDPTVARRQHRWDRLEQAIAGGCHLDRDIAAIVRASPLELEQVDTFTIRGPKVLSFMYAGRAAKAA